MPPVLQDAPPKFVIVTLPRSGSCHLVSAEAGSLSSDRDRQFSGQLADGYANWNAFVEHATATGHARWLPSAG